MSQGGLGETSKAEAEPDLPLYGCGIAVLLIALLVVGVGVLLDRKARDEQAEDQLAMRQALESLGVGRWSNYPSKIYISDVFTGASTHYYKLSIPPREVDEFLASLSKSGPRRVVQRGGNVDSYDPSWWRPQDENEVVIIEWGRYSWTVAAAKDTGNVYMYFEGH